jgi:hypothetical protein
MFQEIPALYQVSLLRYRVFWPVSSIWSSPVYILSWYFDIARLAVNAAVRLR